MGQTEDDQYAAQQAYIESATHVLERFNAEEVVGTRYDNARVIVRRVDGGLQTTIENDDMSFTLQRETGVADAWEIYEQTADDSQVYHANKDDLQNFKQVIDNAIYE